MFEYLQVSFYWKIIILLFHILQVCLGYQLLTWPTDQVVHLGESFTLACTFSSLPNSVAWLFNGSAVQHAASDILSSDNSSWTLVASTGTAGSYQCEAHYELGSVVSIPALIQIGYIHATVDTQLDVSGHSGSWALLSCAQIESLPRPQRLWSKQGLGGQSFRTDSSIYELVNGSMLFTNLSSSHAGVYTCHAINPASQQSRSVQYNLTITSESSTDVNALHLLFPSSLLISTGGTAIFQCFVDSSYTSLLSWSHNGARISSATASGYSITDNGATLAVSGAALAHSGEYACAADGLGSLSAQLTVLDPPVMLAVEETAIQIDLEVELILDCSLMLGTFGVEWTWLRNGIPVNENGSLSLNGGTISTSHIRSSDEGYYQCIASNSVGRATMTYRVEVISYPPFFLLDQPRTEFIHFARSPLLINCSADSVPPPNYSWSKDSQPIDASSSGGIYSFPESGILTMSHLSTQDSGSYACSVRNSVGTIQRRIGITVIPDALQFTREPSSQNFSSEGTNFLVCEARVDSSLTLSFSWFVDGNELQTNGRVQYLSPGTGTLRFNSTQPSDAGRYQCRVEARDSINSNQVIDSSLSSREVSINVLNVPGAPSQLDATNVSNDSISLTWDDVAATSTYHIRLAIKYSNGTLIHARTDTQANTYTHLNSLLPYTLYLVQISAENSIGVGPWSEPPLYVRTHTGVPTANPFGLSSHQIKEDSFLLKWNAPPERSLDQTGRNGEVIKYEITLTSEQDSVPSGFFSTQSNLTHYTLTGLAPYTLYRVSVVALGFKGKSPPSPDIRITTLATEPGAGPKDLMCVAGSMTSLACKIILPDLKDRNGFIDGFLIDYREENETVWSTDSVFEYALLSYLGDVREFELNGLIYNTTYQLNVSFINVVENAHIVGPSSQPHSFILEKPVPGPPSNLKLFSLANYSILANWSLPSRLNGPFSGYSLELKIVGGEVLASEPVNSSTTQHEFNGLDMDNDYSVSVKALSVGGREGFELESRITLPPGPPSPPELSSQLSGSTVFFLWRPGATGGSRILAYRLEYSDGADWSELDVLNSSVTDYHRSLSPGTFKFHVIAVTRLGATASNEEEVSIPQPSLFYQLIFLGFGFLLLLLVLICCVGGVWLLYIWHRSRKKRKSNRSFHPHSTSGRNKRLSYLESTYDFASDAASHEEINPQFLTEDRIVRGPDLSTLELEVGEPHETPPYNLQPHILHLSPSLSSLQKPSQDNWNIYTAWNKPTHTVPPIPESAPLPESRDYVEMKGLVHKERAAGSDSSADSFDSFVEKQHSPPHQHHAALQELYANIRNESNISLTPITPAPNFLFTSPQYQMLPFPQTFVSMSEWSISTAETDPRCQTFV